MIKVGVLGAQGKMGAQVCQAVSQAADLELVAALDVGDDREPLRAADVVVDFTTPAAVMDNLQWCLSAGLSVVVGTTGFDEERLDRLRTWLADAPTTTSTSATPRSPGVLVAPNFGIAAVLMMRFAAQAARWFDSVEIVELHHAGKADAPERHGAAYGRAHRRGAGERGVPVTGPDATSTALVGARGASVSGIPVHAIRLRGLVAHQEVLFGTAGETLTIRHDSLDRESFMPGVLLAVRHVVAAPGLTYGIDDLLGL